MESGTSFNKACGGRTCFFEDKGFAALGLDLDGDVMSRRCCIAEVIRGLERKAAEDSS